VRLAVVTRERIRAHDRAHHLQRVPVDVEREIRADLRPARSAVRALEEILRPHEPRLWVVVRNDDGRVPVPPIRSAGARAGSGTAFTGARARSLALERFDVHPRGIPIL